MMTKGKKDDPCDDWTKNIPLPPSKDEEEKSK